MSKQGPDSTTPKPSDLDKTVEKMRAEDKVKAVEAKIIRDKAVEKGCLIHTGQRFDVIKNPVPGGKDILSCPQCRKDVEEEDKKAEAERKRQVVVGIKRREKEDLARRIESAKIPAMYKDCTLEDYEIVNDGQKNALARVYQFVSVPLDKAGPGLLLRGTNGTGKTHLAIATMNNVLERGYSALYAKGMRIFNNVNDARNDPARTVEGEIEKYTSPDFLVIEELGVQSGTPFELNCITDIFDTRHAELRPTFILGNTDKEAVDKLLGLRILDRYAQGGGDILFNWDSYRRKGGK